MDIGNAADGAGGEGMVLDLDQIVIDDVRHAFEERCERVLRAIEHGDLVSLSRADVLALVIDGRF